jgi:hypothetical protein
MSKEQDNKAVVGRWFTEFWGETCNLAVVDDIAAPDMLLKYSLHEPRRGRGDIKAFMTDFLIGSRLPAVRDWPEDALHWHHRPASRGRKIVEEIGPDDGVTALTQLGLMKV